METYIKNYCTCADPAIVFHDGHINQGYCRDCGKATYAHLFHRAISVFSRQAQMRLCEDKDAMVKTALGQKMMARVRFFCYEDMTQEDKDELLMEKLAHDYAMEHVEMEVEL